MEIIIKTDKPLLKEADIVGRFGECIYSCQLTSEPSWFHTVKFKEFTIYIEEWPDDEDDNEIYATVFVGEDKGQTFFANTDLIILLNDIEEFIRNKSNR